MSVRFLLSSNAGRAERNGVERTRARQRSVLDHDLSRLFCLGSVRRFFSFFFLVLRPFLRALNLPNLPPGPIGVAALSCAGQLAPRTSSYPDS